MKKTTLLVLATTLMAGPAFAASDLVKIHCTMNTQVKRDRSYNEMLAAYKQEGKNDNFLLGVFLPIFAMNSFNAGIETVDLEYSKSEKKGTIVHTQVVHGPFSEEASNETNDSLSEFLDKNTSSAHLTQLLENGQAKASDLIRIREEISSLPKKLEWETTHPTQKDLLGSESACFPQTKMGQSCMARHLGVKEVPNSSLVVISALGRFVLGKDLAHSKLDLDPINCKVVEGDILLSQKQIAQEDAHAKQLKDTWEQKQKQNLENAGKDLDLPVDASMPPY